MHIKANGIEFHCLVDGKQDAPWVTFITGIANDVRLWAGQVAALERDFRILRFDLRGHGRTDAGTAKYTLPILIDDVLKLWDALSIDHSSVVGLGLGGSIAIGIGVDHSDRLDRLVPCCCRAVMTPDFASIWPKFIDIVERSGMEGMVEPTVQRWFTEDFRAAYPQVLDDIRDMIRATSLTGYRGCIGAFLSLDFSAGLHRISVPTLFISGANDHLGGPAPLMAGLAAAVPGARHVSIPAAAHIANIQNPQAFNAAVAEFLRG